MTERLPTAHGARGALISNRRLWQAAWWIGIAMAALALLFALERHWLLAVAGGVAAAAVLWLSGAWVGPWSADAYVRRVRRAWDSWAAGAQWAYDAFADHRRPRFVDRVQRLRPPQEWVDEHARLLGLLAEGADAGAERSIRVPERTRRAVAAGQAARELRRRLAERAQTADQRRYLDGLSTAFQRQREDHAQATATAEQATERVVRRLRRMRAPDVATVDHERLIQRFEAYLVAQQRLRAAYAANAPDAASAAAADLEAAASSLRAAHADLLAGVDYEARWPRSPPPAAAEDSGG